ncbi:MULTISPECIES: LssY C-terminal domain-containing protein [Halanaerobium]|jgi:undecaprenyl-diphosphatase|uniref:Undecaprenyl-diphosphatase n=2 Tax=Halanaerobium TaxID=2330 RepID=A0A2T5RQI0_9FIRM|nr:MULTISPECIES: LssY C-terminal domain-containing protein [Halanaerobium]PTW02236.1 undecaprenyl-diphosphatase [Halanaerobium saccharolyticum]RCW62235.1 undecaprenyl-diphosphatase [Halanaerobium sp. ST460_2HS_T2]SIR37782.1 undecaprenyl-diphosphatase [Halanaerobium kushneri]
MSNYYNYLISLIQNFSIFGYLLIAILAFFESFAFIGLIVPGSIAVIIGGFLAAHGSLNIIILYLLVFLAAVLGDNYSFRLGRNKKVPFNQDGKIFNQELFIKGRKFFEHYGAKSVFLGRFVGWVRPIIPFIAGFFELDAKVFLLWNILSSILWAASHIALGYFFGRTWQLVALWSTRFTIFFTGLIVFVILIYLLKHFALSRGKELLTLLVSIGESIKRAVIENKEVKEFVEQHKAFFSFLRKRFDRNNFFGLPVTLFVLSLIYVMALLGGIIEDFLTTDLIISVDHRIANLLTIFRNETLTDIFFWITFLGKWQVILVFTFSIILILWLWNKKSYIIPILISITGSVLFTYIGKLLFHRPRPVVAIYQESSFSFPSGHATISVAFYGFLTYFLVKEISSWKNKINIFFTGLILIIAIGFSRLYLGVHFLSDVWAGYLVGALWLIIAISVSEYLTLNQKNIFHKFKDVELSGLVKQIISVIIIILAVGSYTFFSLEYQIPYRTTPPQKPLIVSKALNVFEGSRLKYTESLLGEKGEPISFIIVANNEKQLIRTFQSAGWNTADEINIYTLYKAAKAALLKKPYPSAPVTPDFWNSKVNDLAFEKPDSSDNIRVRHHARFWETNFITNDGEKIYVGTASFDSGIKWGITHKIDPDIDSEREYLFDDLETTSLIKSAEKYQFVAPKLGSNFVGDPFFTDGKAYILVVE